MKFHNYSPSSNKLISILECWTHQMFGARVCDAHQLTSELPKCLVKGECLVIGDFTLVTIYETFCAYARDALKVIKVTHTLC
jgi:hypothetical protein